jgi:ubiquitin-activating enzyme E1
MSRGARCRVRALQEALGELRMFMVGTGALGCEFIKNFALLGFCCGCGFPVRAH